MAAQLAVVQGETGPVVREEPLAFAVPFNDQLGADRRSRCRSSPMVTALVQVIPWSAMTPVSKALRVDGQHPRIPITPIAKRGRYRRPGHEDAAKALAPALTEALALLPTIRLAAVGDVNFDRSPAYIMQTTGDLSHPLSLVKPVFDQADYTIANLETSLR